MNNVVFRNLKIPDGWELTKAGLYTPVRQKPRYDRPTCVSLFSGAGGMDLGMVKAGFHVVAAVEYDVWAVITYMVNQCRWGQVEIHFIEEGDRQRMETALMKSSLGDTIRAANGNPTKGKPHSDGLVSASIYSLAQNVPKACLTGSGWIAGQPDVPGCPHVFVGDIRKLSGQRILDAIGLEKGEVTCVCGGPPCQGFSRAGKQVVMDPRNSLVFEYTRMIREIMPQTFVFENVPGIVEMVTPEGIPVLDAIALDIEKGGFGAYEAIRRSLSLMPNARVGVKRAGKAKEDVQEKKRAKRPHKPKTQPRQYAKQTTLFDLEAVIE